MEQKRPREVAIYEAVAVLLERRHGRWRFDHHPDLVRGVRRPAPDALYLTDASEIVMIEVTELSRKVPLQLSRARAQRSNELVTMYPVDASTDTVQTALRAYLDEAERKFKYRQGAFGLLALDTASYVGGPIRLKNAIRALTNWSGVTDVAIVVDEPYGNLPEDDAGEVSDSFRVWFARS